MAELYPLSLRHHLRRIQRELAARDQIFDLPRARFYVADPALDTSVRFHGQTASTALGPAAGPQDQLIQNIVLAWLGGSRLIELKTVQIQDELRIPRPCIHAPNIGFNVEWSQELRLEKSLREYVAASMLLEILAATDVLGNGLESAARTRTVLDMSVGYDLAGISHPRVTGWIRQMMDASAVIDELRAEIPDEFAQFRDHPFTTQVSRSITLSTFHGCPPDEIEKIVAYLLTEVGTNTVIKLNPTQLGKERLEYLLHDVMGYTHLEVHQKAYSAGLSLDEAVGIVERLRPVAQARGLELGVKFSNTLEVVNRGDWFSDAVMYMSGPPLHVIAMNLVDAFRKKCGTRYPISFSAGIDHENFWQAVSLGLVPVTVCTDLLKPRGYGRQVTYLRNLEDRMRSCGARTIEEFIVRGRGRGPEAVRAVCSALSADGREGVADLERSLLAALEEKAPLGADADVTARLVREATLLNTSDYVAECTVDPRYGHGKNKTAPKKIGSHLYLWDCISCDKCIPVCPNDANFLYEVKPRDVTWRNLRVTRDGVLPEEEGRFKVTRATQIANYADFCNECGNCDTFCPEYGGPYIMKPRFFSTPETYATHADRDGFVVVDGGLRGRILGREYSLRPGAGECQDVFSDGILEVDVVRASGKVVGTRVLGADAFGHVTDLKNYWQLVLLLEGVMERSNPNYINVAVDGSSRGDG